MTKSRNTKPARSTALGAAFAVMFSTGAIFATGAQAQTKLLFGYYASATSTVAREGIVPWLEEIEERSDGRLQTEFNAGGAIIKTGTSLFGLRDGLVDIANVYAQAFPKELPVITLLSDLGALMTNDMAAAGALTELQLLACPDCEAEYDNWDIKLIGSYATKPYQLLCRMPITSLDDLKGKRIRGTGHLNNITAAFGATPVNISISEVYEALQRGLVDCTFGQFAWLKDFSLEEQTKYVLTTNAGVVPAAPWIAIRKVTWDALLPEDRKIMYDAMATAVARSIFAYEKDNNDAIELAVSRGVELEPLQEWLTDAIVDAVKDVRSEAVARAVEAGVVNADEIAGQFLTMYAEWEEKVADITTQEAFEELLASEIYSKLDVSE